MSKLIELAKQRPAPLKKPSTITNDDVKLALAWARGVISLSQVSHAYGYKRPGSNNYSKLAQALREYVRRQM